MPPRMKSVTASWLARSTCWPKLTFLPFLLVSSAGPDALLRPLARVWKLTGSSRSCAGFPQRIELGIEPVAFDVGGAGQHHADKAQVPDPAEVLDPFATVRSAVWPMPYRRVGASATSSASQRL